MDPRRARFEDFIRELPPVPGLKFHPTNEQVIYCYLHYKIAGNLVEIDPMRTDQDILSHHPGTHPVHYPLLQPENDWWFYTSRDSKYPNNSKLKIERAGGYWKVSKASDPIRDIGFKRVLNFREGSVKQSSTPTDWYMDEYSIKQFAPNKENDDWIIARIYLTMPMPKEVSFQEGMEGGRSGFENLICQISAVVGLNFHPTNEEVIFYLQNKNARHLVKIDPMRTDQDIISHHPGTLPAHYPLQPTENDWWFYTTRDSKYPNNSKLKIERAGGYWKVSKASNPIGDIGFKRVLNFREGSLKPSSTPTDWYMEEYSIKQFAPNKEEENWIVARIYQQLTMPMPPSNIVPMTMPLSAEPIQITFADTKEIMDFMETWPTPDVYSGEGGISGSAYPFQPPGSSGFGSAYYLPLDSGGFRNYLPLDSREGDFSGSAYPFQPPGSGETGTSTSAFPSPWRNKYFWIMG